MDILNCELFRAGTQFYLLYVHSISTSPGPKPDIRLLKCCGQRLGRARLFATLWAAAARLLCPWDSPGKNTAVGCHFLLPGIFPTRGQTCISCISYIGRPILYPLTTCEVHACLREDLKCYFVTTLCDPSSGMLP